MASMNCVIYQIVCKDSNIEDVYIGSTNDVRKRMSQHKSNCHNPNSENYNNPLYKFIRTNKGWDNWRMEILERFTCNTKFDKVLREREWIHYIKSSLNTYIPANYQTGDVWDNNEYHREWYKINKDKIIEQSKERYKTNKEKISEQNKELYKTNKEQILINID